MEKARDGGMQRQTAEPADSSTEGGISSMPSSKASPISVRRAEGGKGQKTAKQDEGTCGPAKGVVGGPAKQSGVAGRMRSRSIIGPPESGTIEESDACGWHLGSCSHPRVRPITHHE